MIMGVGLIMMGIGAALLVADLVLVLVTAITAPGKKRKMEEYLKEHY